MIPNSVFFSSFFQYWSSVFPSLFLPIFFFYLTSQLSSLNLTLHPFICLLHTAYYVMPFKECLTKWSFGFYIWGNSLKQQQVPTLKALLIKNCSNIDHVVFSPTCPLDYFRNLFLFFPPLPPYKHLFSSIDLDDLQTFFFHQLVFCNGRTECE